MARRAPAPKTEDVVDAPVEVLIDETPAVCNTVGCPRTPTTHGLCDGHWATRRGDAVKESPDV